VIVDLLKEWQPPFLPTETMNEVSALCHRYNVSTLVGDRWGGDFPRQMLRDRNVNYRISEKTTSDAYRALLPLLNSREVELPQHGKAIAQLASLQRRTSSSGKDRISHPSGQHDDLAAAIAVAAAHCKFGKSNVIHWYGASDHWDRYLSEAEEGLADLDCSRHIVLGPDWRNKVASH